MGKYEKVREVAREMIGAADDGGEVKLFMGIIIGVSALEAVGDDEDPSSDHVRELLERATVHELRILLEKAAGELSSIDLRPGGAFPKD